MGIKTRESLRDIKTFDRAKNLAEKSRNGLSDLNREASDTQGGGYSSESEYAGDSLQGYERSAARTAALGAERLGRWGMKRTAKNIRKWRNRPVKVDEPAPKQLPPPKRPALNAPKTAEKSAKTAEKTAEKTAKTAKKTAEASAKAAKKAAEAAKKAAEETVKAAKAAAKAVVAAVKAVVAVIKDIVAAIAAGGWVAVVIIIIIVIIACVVGSVYAIFVPAEDSEITIYSVTRDLEREHQEMENELAATVYYDVLNYDGSLAGWEEVISVYAVKLNLDSKDPQEVATFDESKANALRTVFLDMHDLSLMSETHTRYETRQETDANGNVVEVTEEINTVYVTVITTPKSAAQIAEEYGFTAQQTEMLTELLNSENAELWAGILSE